MADRSKIEWTDASWNPVTGCTKVSKGCDHCYAERVTERFHGKGSFATVQIHEDRLPMPLRWRRPRRVFVNSMSDLFHDDVPQSFIERVVRVMGAARQHTFQLLTKRHARMRALLNSPSFDAPWPLPNVHLIVSVESQQWADIRIPALQETRAAVRGVSLEPLLSPVNLTRLGPRRIGSALGMSFDLDTAGPRHGLDWVVVGGESGPGARPMHPDWARSLRDQCAEFGVPFFFKQWGEWAPLGPVYGDQGEDDEEAEDARIEAAHLEVVEKREVIQLEHSGYIAVGHQPTCDRTWLMARVGKRNAGRLLDGQLHDAYPRGAG